MNGTRSEFQLGVILSYINIGVGTLIPFIITPYLVMKLGILEFSSYKLAGSFIFYFQLLYLGLNGCVVRFLSREIARGDIEAQEKFFKMFFYLFIGIGVLLVIASLLLGFFADSIFPKMSGKIGILISLVGVQLSLNMFGGLYKGVAWANQSFVFLKVVDLISTVCSPLLVGLCLYFGGLSIEVAVCGLCLSIIINLIVIYNLRRVFQIKISKNRVEWNALKEVFHYAKYIFLAGLSSVLYNVTDMAILGIYSTPEVVAYFSVGIVFSRLFSLMLAQSSGMLFPKINSLVTNGMGEEGIDGLMMKVGRLQFFIVGFILTLFFVGGQEFLILWLGSNFLPAFWIGGLLMISGSFGALQSVASAYMKSINRHGFRAKMLFLIAIINIVATLSVVKSYGAIGCVVVSLVSEFLGVVVIMNVYYARVAGLNVLGFWRGIGGMVPTFFTVLCIGLSIKVFIILDSWAMLVLVLSLLAIVYFGAFWAFCLNRFEKRFVLDGLEMCLGLKKSIFKKSR